MNPGDLIEYTYTSGSIADVIESIGFSLNQLRTYNAKVKLGITSNDPAAVFEQQLKSFRWDRMVVIYQCASKNFFKGLLTHFYGVNWKYDDFLADTGEYSLYALVKE